MGSATPSGYIHGIRNAVFPRRSAGAYDSLFGLEARRV
jgi:hypothetical protein